MSGTLECVHEETVKTLVVWNGGGGGKVLQNTEGDRV
jgi:hypothetical protein